MKNIRFTSLSKKLQIPIRKHAHNNVLGIARETVGETAKDVVRLAAMDVVVFGTQGTERKGAVLDAVHPNCQPKQN